MKKIAALLLSLAFVIALCACGAPSTDAPDAAPEGDAAVVDDAGNEASSDVKIGVICIHDENTGYDEAHIAGALTAAQNCGLSADNIVFKYNIPEDETCYDTCVDLAEAGCSLIITDSYGHSSYAAQAAEEYPDITFVSMTGDNAAASGLPNLKNAFCNTYESRYVSGVVAGMKLAELVANGEVADKNMAPDGTIKIGYVGAFPYAEVVSGYTAFFLGVRSIVDNVSMTVTYTNSWFDPTAEAEAANSLMADGCIIISQHADSTGAPSACQAALEAGTTVYCVGYNVDMLSVAPQAALTSAQNDWSVYYTYAFNCLLNGEEIATDWARGYAEGANMISPLGESCAEGTAEKVAEVEAGIIDGSLHVFDCSTWTVGGEHLDSYDEVGFYEGVECIWDGYFHESETRSAPYFDIRIDGITELAN
ncbi:MAG: BMP family ABC transporter substrate-binding protein [Oscillospiraceae bacterium]|nr:BMP family ABC transporter substrate-binding protein [Oscillospiraceae bacterium]